LKLFTDIYRTKPKPMTIINLKTKTIKQVSQRYIDLCEEAYINPTDAVQKKLTEEDLLLFINKGEEEPILEQ